MGESHDPLVFSICHTLPQFTEQENQPFTYSSQGDECTLHTRVLYLMTTEQKIYNSGSNTEP